MSMRTRLLKRLRKLAKVQYVLRYDDGFYEVVRPTPYLIVVSNRDKDTMITELQECRKWFILNEINKMRDKIINDNLKNI